MIVELARLSFATCTVYDHPMREWGFIAGMIGAAVGVATALGAIGLIVSDQATHDAAVLDTLAQSTVTSDLGDLSDLGDPTSVDLDSPDQSSAPDGNPLGSPVVDGSASDGDSEDSYSEYPVGCFAWSKKRGTALCVVGNFTNECFTHFWSWTLHEIPGENGLTTDIETVTPEDRDKHPHRKESRDHMRAPTTDVQPTETDGEFDHSIRPLASLEPRQTLDVLLAAESGKPSQWLRFRWAQTSAGRNRITLQCLSPGELPPDLASGSARAYPTSEAPPLPKGIRKSEVDVFAYEGGSEGKVVIHQTATSNRLVLEHTQESSAECQHSEAHSAAVVTIGRICTASSVGDAASGLRAR